MIIIDALRYDAINNEKMFPTLYKLSKKGLFKKAIANSCSTQFVLPSIFSLTYPLDNGGYNSGIRNRKSSYVESIKKKYNRKILMLSSCNQMGVGTSYDRGFDEILTTFDFRLLIEQKINRTLLYVIDLYLNKKISKRKMTKVVQKELVITFDKLIKFYNKYDKSLWPKKLKKINKFVFENCKIEKEILLKTPEFIIDKIQKVPGGVYWLTLGKLKYNSFFYFFSRFRSGITWRLNKKIGKQRFWPFLFLSHYQVLLSEILNGICKKISLIKNEDWHIHMHLMDLHDSRSVSRFFHLLSRYRFFYRWLIGRILGQTNQRFTYVSSLMYIDQCLNTFLQHLKKENIFNDTLILITSDHGSYYPESPRNKVQPTGQRFHYEDINIPIILAHRHKNNISKKVFDSMDITATLLDLLKVPLDKSYKGQSIFKKRKDFVISENAGSGNSDLLRKDLYFTITTNDYKLMLVLNGKKLKIIKLFNIINDPKEINNLSRLKDNAEYKVIIKKLITTVFNERKKIFIIRGIKKLSDCSKLFC